MDVSQVIWEYVAVKWKMKIGGRVTRCMSVDRRPVVGLDLLDSAMEFGTHGFFPCGISTLSAHIFSRISIQRSNEISRAESGTFER